MNRLKGPELKMPELKVPPFLSDLFYDLRDRRLLPLVALVVAAIAAVPFLLSGSGSHPASPPPTAGGAAVGAAAGGAGGSRFAVVQVDPGLRNPRKRLAHLPAKDPFKQHYTGPVLKPGSAPTTQTSTSTTSSTSGTTTSSTTTTASSGFSESTSKPAGSPASGGGAPAGGGGNGKQPQPIFYAFAIDVQISRTESKAGGGKEKSEPETRQGVLPPTSLPGKKTQVVTYMGISPKTKKPLFLVSTDVTAVFGEARCVSGSGSCQLLEVEPGFPETFVYGKNDVRYKIDVLEVEPVAAGHS
ncbi:MAG TPA: hypothetical protein VNY83_09030 [Solirubrobacterales bacterium]|jgi:hypothetical protein|nr:hypothetical protein [Solirubrobacterales bacterium]